MKHLFFDLDRTLWDFDRNSENALEILFHALELNKKIRSFRAFHTTYKKINATLWHQYGKGVITKETLRTKRFDNTLKSFQINDPDLAKRLGNEYLEISPFQTHLFPNAKEVLHYLKSNGHELHIITNGFREVQFIKLEKSEILPYFDVVVCSEDVGKNKPSIDVFSHALRQANANKRESIMIGDDYSVDIIGAENAGMQGVLFDPEQKHQNNPHRWKIKELKEIPEILPWIAKNNLD